MTDALLARVDRLLEAVHAGNPRAVGRALSLVENEGPELRPLISALSSSTGQAQVVGITGAPGVGKSTLTTELIGQLRAGGERVGVLAVDPTSPFSGGALLGDRVRMQRHATDAEVFIRSMASRGRLGGLSAATPQAVRVLDAAGCATVIVETVGVGQSEVEIAGLADVTLVVLAPGLGDGIQAAKAGILEIGDIYVVNKADHAGAQALVRDLRGMVALDGRTPDQWQPPILQTVAAQSTGLPELLAAIERFRTHAEASGRWQRRRLDRARHEVEALALAALRSRVRAVAGDDLDRLAAAVRDGELDPYTAADQLIMRP